MPRPPQASRPYRRTVALAVCAALLPAAPAWAHAQQPATSATPVDARASAPAAQDDQDQGATVGAQAGASHLFRRLLEGAGVAAVGTAYLVSRTGGAGEATATSVGAVAAASPHAGRPETPAAPGTNWVPGTSTHSWTPTPSGASTTAGASTTSGAGAASVAGQPSVSAKPSLAGAISLPQFSGVGGSSAPKGGTGGVGPLANAAPVAAAIVVSPEPSTAALLAVGAAGVAAAARRRRPA